MNSETRQRNLVEAVKILEKKKQESLALARKGDNSGCVLALFIPASLISLLVFGITYFG